MNEDSAPFRPSEMQLLWMSIAYLSHLVSSHPGLPSSDAELCNRIHHEAERAVAKHIKHGSYEPGRAVFEKINIRLKHAKRNPCSARARSTGPCTQG